MQDIIGGWSEPEQFDAFLANWRAVLERRVDEAVARLAKIDGVRGLILAGGLGRNAAWPLSDIDLLPIYAAGRAEPSVAAIEQVRGELLPRWTAEGWWTGIDIGRLAFTSDEAASALQAAPGDLAQLLADDRWYHSIDKGYGGHAVYDPDGLAAPLAGWLTAHRFQPAVVGLRLARARAEIDEAARRLDTALEHADPLSCVRALHDAVKWLRALLLERWGERDASLARVGTRFDLLATERGLAETVSILHRITDLDDDAVERRMALAPTWVHLRHDRSRRARQVTGEMVAAIDDARDVLRVSAQYELRAWTRLPCPAWLAVPEAIEQLAERAIQLSIVVNRSTRPR